MSDNLTKLLTEISMDIGGLKGEIGEVKGEVKQIHRKLDSMEKKYNGYSERTIRLEENIEELRKLLNDHLHEHERERGWNMQIKAAIAGGLAGGSIGILGGYLAKIIFGGV